MANYALAANAVWSTCNSGNPPGATDNVYLNGYRLDLDGASATYTCVSVTATTNGSTPSGGTIGFTGSGTYTLDFNCTAGTEATLIALTSAANRTLIFTKTMAGGTASGIYGVSVASGTHTLSFANITGGTAVWGLYISGGTNHTLSISGTCLGGSGANGQSAVVITGGTFASLSTIPAATGGPSSANSKGLEWYLDTPTPVVTLSTGGDISGAHGTVAYNGPVRVTVAKGGSVIGACGAVASLAGTILLDGVDLTGTGYPASSDRGMIKVAAGVPLQFSDAAGALKVFCPVPALGTVKKDTVVYTSAAGSEYGTRKDCPVGKAVTSSGYYGDYLANELVGTLASSIVDSVGAVTAAPGILDSAGARTAAPGILDGDGARTTKPGILNSTGARTAYGVLTAAGVRYAEGVLEGSGTIYFEIAATGSTPYGNGEDAQWDADVAAVAAQLDHMTTDVVNLLSADGDGTLNMGLYTLLDDVKITLNTNKDEMIAANTDIQAAYSCDAGTAVAGGGGLLQANKRGNKQ